MKKYLMITFLCSFVSLAVNAQLVDANTTWSEIYYNTFDSTIMEVDTFYYEGDTTINDKNYLKLFKQGELYAGMRENKEEEVYAYFFEQGYEVLLYDFDCKIGDTIQFKDYYNDPIDEDGSVVGHIDTILLNDGKYYEKVYFDNHQAPYIKGIGNDLGIFFGIFYHCLCGDQFDLICFKNNGEIIYKNTKYYDCYANPEQVVEQSTILTNSYSDVKIYPNPSNGIIHFKPPNTAQNIFLNIYNTNGKKIMEEALEGNQVSLHLNKGIYLYKISKNESCIKTGKFVIQ